MDRDANYVAVGAFVLLVVAMAGAFLSWYTGHRDRRSYERYEIYFQGSVSGLTDGSPVRYLGVNVGKVIRIKLDPEHPKRVRVIADIDVSAPIDSRTLASLSLQGITGLLFIDLEQDRNATIARPLAQGEQYPVIASAPSNFDVLLSNLPALTTRTVELVDRFNRVLSDANVRAFNETLDNARIASERLPATIRDVHEMVKDMRQASQEVQAAALAMRSISAQAGPGVEDAVNSIKKAADILQSTAQRLDRLVVDNEPRVTRFTKQSLPAFEQLLRESREAAREFRDLSRSLKDNPSQLMFEPRESGVEVPK